MPKLTQTRIRELIALDLGAILESIRLNASQPLTYLEAIEIYLDRHPSIDPDELGIAVRLDQELFRNIEQEAFNAKLIKEKLPESAPPTCPHCGSIGSGMVMARWHGDRCKKRPQIAVEGQGQASVQLRLPDSPKPPESARRPSVPNSPKPSPPIEPIPEPKPFKDFKVMVFQGYRIRRKSRDLLTID